MPGPKLLLQVEGVGRVQGSGIVVQSVGYRGRGLGFGVSRLGVWRPGRRGLGSRINAFQERVYRV